MQAPERILFLASPAMTGALQQGEVVVDLDHVEAPLALCSKSGSVCAATPLARDLFGRMANVARLPADLPGELWAALEAVPAGHAVEWRPHNGAHEVLGCTRYHAAEHYLLLMNEISDKHAALSRRLHRQRLEATGRLVASIAHEVRNSVASIVYSADFLAMKHTVLRPETVRDTAREMLVASRRVQSTVDGLLDYARLGPTVTAPVSLLDVLTRAQGLLRSVYIKRGHRLHVDIAPSAQWVRGNSLTVEQILVNLLLNAAECVAGTVSVVVSSARAPSPAGGGKPDEMVCVRVSDDGPGVPARLRQTIFEPFFTTREQGTGLGLTNAREAAESLGGALRLEDAPVGACFAIYLPVGEPG